MNAPDLTPTQTWGEHRGDVEIARDADYFRDRAMFGEVHCPVAEARWRSFAEMYPKDDA